MRRREQIGVRGYVADRIELFFARRFGRKYATYDPESGYTFGWIHWRGRLYADTITRGDQGDD